MKTNTGFVNRSFAAFLAASLLLLPALAQAGSAEDTTNNPNPGTVSNAVAPTPPAVRSSEPDNVLGVPAEVLNRLSPEQIASLMHAYSDGHQPMPGEAVAILVPLSSFAMIIAIIGIGVSAKVKRNNAWHQTIRLMIEKGQPIPPELLRPQVASRRPRSDLRSGLLFVALGAAVMIAAWMGHFQGIVLGLSLVPLFIGIAFLITWKIESQKNGQPK